MEKIGLSKFKANCVEIVERVARTGEPVTITQKGMPVARLVSPHAHHADQAKLAPVAATLDLDEDVIDAEELLEAEQTVSKWDALNSAIAQDVGAAAGGKTGRSGSPAKKPFAKSAPKKTGKSKR
jgi:prevent-host-death family protein